jgi:hypothetical protein
MSAHGGVIFCLWCRVNHEKYAIEFSSLVHQTKDYLSGFEDALMRDHKIRVPEFSDLKRALCFATVKDDGPRPQNVSLTL